MRPTRPTPYADLNEVLRELIARVQTVLRDDFIGAYLQGSFAIGDFDVYSAGTCRYSQLERLPNPERAW